MIIDRIFGHLPCRSLDASIGWFETLFDRAPDARPMDGLAEWHHGAGGLQLFEDPPKAGMGTLTLIVQDIAAEHARLTAAGHQPEEIAEGNYVRLAKLADPDGNLVVLAQPKAG